MADHFDRKCDLLKLRAEQYQRNYLSLRLVEWRVAFQSYAGYTTISLAYAALKPESGPSCLLACLLLVGTALLYYVSLYVSVRIQERMQFYRGAENLYLDALHAKLRVAKLEAGATDDPIHKSWYAFGALQVIHLTAFLAVLGFIGLKSDCTVAHVVAIVAGAPALFLLFIAAGWFRIHSGKFKPTDENAIWSEN